ncbi:MAG TPA: hypothetical protein PK137_00105 [Anaerolineaceae bacterium]|jgi:hypothetical protein|nr:hypothetical protein [Anaerolineaceae bacterium]HOR83903.1 hypothetical protein [Anaerolineaceae bacterium]HPL42239.1 hypothetical protein [Anaerolineaceae bacterium]
MKKTLLLFPLVLSLLLAACSSKPAAPTEPASNPSATLPAAVETSPQTTYPSAEMMLSSAYPIKLPDGVPLNSLSAPAEALPPQEGFASISGLLYAYDISQILVNTDFWLFPAVTVGDQKVPPPLITNGDPAEGDIYGRTDANGAFYLDRVPAGDYFLLINYPDHTVFGQASPTPDAYLLITVAAGDRVAYGVIYTLR